MSNDSRRRPTTRAMLRRYARGAGLFVGGAAWGAALVWQLAARPQQVQHGAAASVTSGAALSGLMRDALPQVEATRGVVEPDALGALAVVEEPVARPALAREVDVAEGAQRALGYSVHIEGGGGYGAGFFADADGHVLTCEHVVRGLDQVEVTLASGESRTARVLARDAMLDLALLEVDATPPSVRPAVLGSVTEVALGQTVYSMGSPRGMSFSLGAGMVSFVGRRFEGVSFIQTELALNGGSSGGPVFDRHGRVVAVSSFVLRDSEGLAYALPIDYALRRFAGQLSVEPGNAQLFDAWQKAHDAPAARSGLSPSSTPH